jgi:inosine-uridine nucleoside N-ribohydrolase
VVELVETTSARPVPLVIDCDPGTDDVAALVLAKQLDELEIFDVKAITTVAGNTELINATRNALGVRELLRWDLPIAQGADKPLTRRLETAGEIHGSDGLRGVTLPEQTRGVEPVAAWDLIAEIARESETPIDIVAVGPLTNIAIFVARYPELVGQIRRVVVMGGAILAGNTTAAAEFNAYVDPEAAKVVFRSGIPVYLCPLDVTHAAYITAEELEEIRALGSAPAALFADVLSKGLPYVQHYSGGMGVAIHDPMALMFAAELVSAENGQSTQLRESARPAAEDQPVLNLNGAYSPSSTPKPAGNKTGAPPQQMGYFWATPTYLDIETRSPLTRGMTVTDRYSDSKREPNGFMVDTIDRGVFISRIVSLLARYNPSPA